MGYLVTLSLRLRMYIDAYFFLKRGTSQLDAH